MYFENCTPSIKDLLLLLRASKEIELFPGLNENNFRFVGSGKASIGLICQYLKEKKILSNKMDAILVSQWMGIAVYQTYLHYCFPVTKFSSDVKSIVAYHQYGYPQDMDKILDFCQSKKVTLIEDCAHALHSFYRGRPLGTFGDFSIFSFSKFLFCFALGGVTYKDNEFGLFLENQAKNSSLLDMFFINAFKAIDEFIVHKGVNLNALRQMAYSIYHKSYKYSSLARKLLIQKIEYEIAQRRKNYHYILDELKNFDFVQDLERDIIPFAVPFLIKKGRDEIINAVKKENIEVGEYSFDTNRFVIAPKFEKCVLIPIQSNMTNRHIDIVIESVKKFCRK